MQRRNFIDEETLQGLNQNEDKAQTQVFDYYYDGLVVYSQRITGSYEASEEIASEAITRLFLMPFKHFTHLGGLNKWLRETVTNLSIDHTRQSKKFRNHISYDDSLREIEAQFDRIVEFEQGVMHMVLEAMKELPARQKLVIQYKLTGLTTKEIADLLQLKNSTILNHKCHAIKFIRQYLVNRGKFQFYSDF